MVLDHETFGFLFSQDCACDKPYDAVVEKILERQTNLMHTSNKND